STHIVSFRDCNGELSYQLPSEILIRFISFFFFSSRRRHTRWPRDWSSDVCSSDLIVGFCGGYQLQIHIETAIDLFLAHDLNDARSEERRVGKECRSRWWRYD